MTDLVAGIGLDLDHTLAIDNRLERVAFLHLLEIVLERGGHTIGTLDDEIAAIDELLHRQRCGEWSIGEAVERFVSARGLAPDEWFAATFRQTAVDMVEQFVVPLPGVGPTIAALRERGIVLAVLTNGWDPLQTRKAQRAGFSGTVLVSSEIGERKPEFGAFAKLLETLRTDPDQTWYVGDDARGDIAGAHAAGMSGIWFNWERHEYPPDLRRPEHTIEAFGDLLRLVPQIARVS